MVGELHTGGLTHRADRLDVSAALNQQRCQFEAVLNSSTVKGGPAVLQLEWWLGWGQTQYIRCAFDRAQVHADTEHIGMHLQ